MWQAFFSVVCTQTSAVAANDWFHIFSYSQVAHISHHIWTPGNIEINLLVLNVSALYVLTTNHKICFDYKLFVRANKRVRGWEFIFQTNFWNMFRPFVICFLVLGSPVVMSSCAVVTKCIYVILELFPKSDKWNGKFNSFTIDGTKSWSSEEENSWIKKRRKWMFSSSLVAFQQCQGYLLVFSRELRWKIKNTSSQSEGEERRKRKVATCFVWLLPEFFLLYTSLIFYVNDLPSPFLCACANRDNDDADDENCCNVVFYRDFARETQDTGHSYNMPYEF